VLIHGLIDNLTLMNFSKQEGEWSVVVTVGMGSCFSCWWLRLCSQLMAEESVHLLVFPTPQPQLRVHYMCFQSIPSPTNFFIFYFFPVLSSSSWLNHHILGHSICFCFQMLVLMPFWVSSFFGVDSNPVHY
jgi:hypothetical protein